MMNPIQFKIDDNIVAINSDFRTWVKIELLMQDEKLSEEEKYPHLFKLVFGRDTDITEYDYSYINECIMLVSLFLFGKREFEKSDGEDEQGSYDKIYCYKTDKNYIKASFLKVYGFDPWAVKYLHWWDFKAYFEGLRGFDYLTIKDIRQHNEKGMKGKELSELRKLKRQFKIKSDKENLKNEYFKLLDKIEFGTATDEEIKKFNEMGKKYE